MSKDVIKNRTDDMSHDILRQGTNDIKVSFVKLNESTDVAHCSQLNTVIRSVKNKEVLEHILFSKLLKIATKSQVVFNLIKQNSLKHDLNMNNIGSNCTDNAPDEFGNRSRFAALLKKRILWFVSQIA